jgi:hypothetical protein
VSSTPILLDEEVEDFFKKYPQCPNPEHSPKTVEYLVPTHKYYKEQKNVRTSDR